MAAPPQFEFIAGAVYQRGYHLTITALDAAQTVVARWNYHQGLAAQANSLKQGMCEREPAAQAVHLIPGTAPRVLFNPRNASLPPVSLRLATKVLMDQNQVEVQARLNPGAAPESVDAWLRVFAPGGGTVHSEPVTLRRGTSWHTVPLTVGDWAPGHYRIALQLAADGRTWPDGPSLVYRRRAADPGELIVSPFSPYRLRRDPTRPAMRITPRFGAVFASKMRGFYAVFARFEHSGGILRIGRGGWQRAVSPPDFTEDVFVAAADLTGQRIEWLGSRDPQSRLAYVRLEPVTAASVREFYATLGNSSLPMYGVNDWAEYFADWLPQSPAHFQSILAGQRELGFRSIGWSIGRSWVEYHSELPAARTFPCVEWDDAKQSPTFPRGYDYTTRVVMMNRYDPLAEVLASRAKQRVEIWPWLSMQRHYTAEDYGGIFSCPFFRQHPEWRRVGKDGRKEELSYYYPEVRKERVDILMEVAAKGVDGLLIGCDRQPPMALYEPEMVREFREHTGIDPMRIDADSGDAYRQWIAWRADFFTRTLRELRARLDPLRRSSGKPIPVAVRLPSSGLALNLAEGLDVATWCREGLVQQIHLDPLEQFGGEGRHDVRPYLEIGRRYGVRIIGGIGATAFQPFAQGVYGGLLPGLLRARGLHQAGVEGIDAYETETLAWHGPARFLMSLIGNPEQLEKYLEESNLDACYPVDGGTAAAGHDNHSNWRGGWSTKGSGRFRAEGFGYTSME